MSGNPRSGLTLGRGKTDMHCWARAPCGGDAPGGAIGRRCCAGLARKAAEDRSMNEFRTGQAKDAGGLRAAGLGTGKDTPAQSLASKDLVSAIESRLDRRRFQDQHWSGTFWEYLDLCAQNTSVLRNAYQRLYD